MRPQAAELARPKWYIEGVKPLENQKWTTKDREYVYTLRMRGETPRHIASLLGVGVIKIYNLIRLQKNLQHKTCTRCKEDLTPAEVKSNQGHTVRFCNKCKKKIGKYKQSRRNEFNEQGLCIYCGQRKAIKDKKSCRKCISSTIRRRNKEGLCGRCGLRPVAKGLLATCKICASEQRTKLRPLTRAVKI